MPPISTVISPIREALQGALPALVALEGFVRLFPVVAQVVERVVQVFFVPRTLSSVGSIP